MSKAVVITSILVLTIIFTLIALRGKVFETADTSLSQNVGKTLAEKYCQSCHQLPDPSQLTKSVWEHSVLPVMGLYLGTTPLNGVVPTPVEDSLFPDKPVLNEEEWLQLKSYFLENAPDELIQQAEKPAPDELTAFDVILPNDSAYYGTTSVTSFVRIDTTVMPSRLLVANSMGKELFVFDDQLKFKNSYRFQGPLVDLLSEKDQTLACVIGVEIIANDLETGSILEIGGVNNKPKATKGLFEKLARPVQIEAVDLDNDNLKDYLICQFGNLTGELTWMRNNGDKTFTEKTLIRLPGAQHVVVNDYNGDGKEDLWLMVSQGEEGIVLLTNKGSGEFDIKKVVQYPPSYGSSYFELADVNKDGNLDIVYTCGDNGDYSRILKPYHGIYIFLNDGRNNFKRSKFIPVNGCYKVLARDFDSDGDLDLASISYFPANATPWEAFSYWENLGGLEFKCYTLPQRIPFQRGVTMDAGDINNDGKLDIILGNGYFTSDITNGQKEPLFIVLKKK